MQIYANLCKSSQMVMQMSLPAQVPGGMAAVGSVTEHGRRVGLEAARGARRRRVGPSRRPAHRRLRQS